MFINRKLAFIRLVFKFNNNNNKFRKFKIIFAIIAVFSYKLMGKYIPNNITKILAYIL